MPITPMLPVMLIVRQEVVTRVLRWLLVATARINFIITFEAATVITNKLINPNIDWNIPAFIICVNIKKTTSLDVIMPTRT
jgi:hypothetical protein